MKLANILFSKLVQNDFFLTQADTGIPPKASCQNQGQIFQSLFPSVIIARMFEYLID